MPRNQFQVGQKIAFGGLILLFLGLAGCERGGVGARDLSGSSGSSITMPRELRTALEEALPTGSSGGQLPDADEAFLYGVGIGAIQELYVEAYHPREIALAGLKNLGKSSQFSLRSSA